MRPIGGVRVDENLGSRSLLSSACDVNAVVLRLLSRAVSTSQAGPRAPKAVTAPAVRTWPSLPHALCASHCRISYVARLVWRGIRLNYMLLPSANFAHVTRPARDVWVCTVHTAEEDRRDSLFFEPDHVH